MQPHRNCVCLLLTHCLSFQALVVVVCYEIGNTTPLAVQVVIGACCWACVKIRKYTEQQDARHKPDGTSESARGFVYSDMPGMEDKLIDLDEVVPGQDLSGMVLMHATGDRHDKVFQGQVVAASPSRPEAGVFYCDSVPATPVSLATEEDDVRTGCVHTICWRMLQLAHQT